MSYELFYWDGIQGRGEFVRLALEEAGAAYVNVTREPGRGTDEMIELIKSGTDPSTPFAPPFLKDGKLIVSHVANMLFYIGPKLGLAPEDEAQRWFANGLQLTITDFVAEVHDTHHPIALSKYFEDQKSEAETRTAEFIRYRIPKFLGYFECVLKQNNDGRTSVGQTLTYVDLSLLQLMQGLRYAFPKTMRDHAKCYPALTRLHDAVMARPKINAYLNSPRRLPFSEEGIFRHYPELDIAP